MSKHAHEHREPWLHEMVGLLRPMFARHGYPIPMNLRVSCGWPSHRALGTGSRVIGQCWGVSNSKDGTFEVFVSPALDDQMAVAAILAHELVHASVGLEAGHKGPFRKLATSIGLEGKMTATHAGDAFRREVAPLLAQVGPYPHASLDGSNRKKQTTRLLKAECAECGYTVRITRKWWEEVGAPHCPAHGEMCMS